MKSRLIVFAVSAVLIIGGLLYAKNDRGIENLRELSLIDLSSKPKEDREVPQDAWEYRSLDYKFSLLYPEGMSVKEFDEGGGAKTVIFENTEIVSGFQIFVVPYGDNKISEERFRMDVPSKVRTDLKNIEVGGVEATSFYSTNFVLGDTYEIWLINNGYLYELTTLKQLEPFLNEVVATWEFI
ncbi:MAG: hypothetical protein WAX80_02115 [Minisyncoccia bacterium]